MARSTRPTSLQSCLQSLGANRVEASLLADLCEHGASATDQIITRTGLRQPEVSVGMRALRERGWIQSSPIPREGKGRPMHKYELTLQNQMLADHFTAQGHKRIQALEKAIQKVEDRLGS